MNSGHPLPAADGAEFEAQWTRILEGIRKEVNEYTFRAWYEPLRCMGLENNSLVVQGPDNFFVDWFTENCFEPLERAAMDEISGITGVRIEASPEPEVRVDPEPAPSVPAAHPRPRRAAGVPTAD